VWKGNDRVEWKPQTKVRWKEKRWQILTPFIGFGKIGARVAFHHGQQCFQQDFEFEILERKVNLTIITVEANAHARPKFEVPEGKSVTLLPSPVHPRSGYRTGVTANDCQQKRVSMRNQR